MLKLGEVVEVHWNPMNKTFYENKGYVYTKNGGSIFVKVEDLQPSARVKVKVICDYCHKEFEMLMYAYTRSTKNSTTVACDSCKVKKTRNTMLEKYGTENCMQVPEIRHKMVTTLEEKYGVSVPSQLPQHTEAMKHYDKELAKERYIQTCLNRYGVDNAAKLPATIDKMKQTCIEKYGGESSQCDPSVHYKTIQSMLDGGIMPTSKPERQMIELLRNIYGDSCCHPQYNFGNCCFDCLLEVQGIKIDIEYDGKYWHNQKQEKDKRRDFYVMRRGIKVLRFRGDTTPPTKEMIIKGVNYLVDSGHLHYVIDIEDEDIV